MKYLVTGGAGFIGSHITEYLINRGDSVAVIDNFNTGKEKNLESVMDKIEFFKGDILDFELLKKITKDVDGVFHEAALASVQESFDKPDEYHNVNVNGTENVLKLAKQFGIKVVYASTSSVFGDPKNIPIKEQDEKNPINPYAETKLKDEEFVPTLKKSCLISLSIDRIFAFTTSLTWTKSLNCVPSPLIFGGNLSLILSKNNFITPAYSFDCLIPKTLK